MVCNFREVSNIAGFGLGIRSVAMARKKADVAPGKPIGLCKALSSIQSAFLREISALAVLQRGSRAAAGRWVAGLAGICLMIAGCGSGETSAANDPAPQRDVFGRLVTPGANGATEPAAPEGWSIVLGAFSPDRDQVDVGAGLGNGSGGASGQSFEAAAHTALFRAQAMAGLSGVTLEKRGNGLVLLYGSFPSGTSTDAQRELAYVRSIEVGGSKPYEAAFLAPPGASAGTMPDYDLATVKARRGTKKPLYTLQIAVYGRTDNTDASKDDLVQFRKAAEEAVTRLRHDGEQAYYYHGPNRSMVTIGVFTEQDAGFGGRLRGEGAPLMAARQKFPNNLLNGEAVRERTPGRQGSGASDFRLQPSRLVEVPD